MPAKPKPKIFPGLKMIIKYVIPYKREVTFLTVLSVLTAVVDATIPYFAGKIIDSILSPSAAVSLVFYTVPAAFFFIALWFFVKASGDVFDWLISLRKERLSLAVEAEFLIRGFGHLLDLPLSFHKTHKMGEVTNRISRASGWLESIIGRVLVSLAPQILSVIIALFIVFWIKPLLASVLVAGVLVYVAILLKITPGLARIQEKGHKAYSQGYGDAYDAALNIRQVKDVTAEEHEKKKLQQNFLVKAARIWYEYIKIWQGVSFSQRLIISAVQAAIFLISLSFIWQKQMTIGQLVMFNGYAAMFFGPFVILGQNWQMIQNGLIAVKRAEKILNYPKETYEPKTKLKLTVIKGRVEFKNVGFAYKKGRKILDGISFKVDPGEVVALVGESGVGKTTLVDLISGYFKAAKGEILVDGHDIGKIGLKFLRSQIAVVPQEVLLFNDTVKKNIRYGNFRAGDEEVTAAAEKAYAGEFIGKFPKKYEQVVGERGIKLSAGQKQRVAIARAILRDPKILILDEPTSALDAQSERYVVEALGELMKNRTTFIIAHRLSTIRRADKILVLESGRLAEEGKHEDLIKIKNGVYRKLYELQKL